MRVQTRRQQIQELQAENRRLAKTQELLVDNILTVQGKEITYTGNRYKDYTSAVVEVASKYSGTADWGVLQVGNIVDLRAAYIVGQGIKIKKVVEGEGNAEYEFAMRFIAKNKLDHEFPQDLAREAEIEGKTLIKLSPTTAPVTVDEPAPEVDIEIRWISWTTNKYTVNVKKDDYMQVENVTYQSVGGSPVTLSPLDCVYGRFAGRLDIPNDTMPRVAKCLTQIENLDMALRDWRQINKLYAAPTPHCECLTKEQAKEVNEAMDKVNWKIGKFFAHTGTFSYAQPSAEGQEAIESEIVSLMKVISGTTGIPLNALGCPELTTKYGADSQGTQDLIDKSTSKEREVWRGVYQEIIEKAMRMWNATTQKTALDPTKIKVELLVVTAQEWERIVSVWLPIKNSGEITSKTFLSQIPGLDVEAELKAKEKESEVALERFNARKIPPEEEADEEGNNG